LISLPDRNKDPMQSVASWPVNTWMEHGQYGWEKPVLPNTLQPSSEHRLENGDPVEKKITQEPSISSRYISKQHLPTPKGDIFALQIGGHYDFA